MAGIAAAVVQVLELVVGWALGLAKAQKLLPSICVSVLVPIVQTRAVRPP